MLSMESDLENTTITYQNQANSPTQVDYTAAPS